MNIDRFMQNLDGLLTECKNTLTAKRAEYSKDGDVLHNFKRAGMEGSKPGKELTPEQALIGMVRKHWTSILDMVDDIDAGKFVTLAQWREKVKDTIDYIVLLENTVIDLEHYKKEDAPQKTTNYGLQSIHDIIMEKNSCS
jgi:hypothetical protein